MKKNLSKREQKRRTILAGARKVFERKGFIGVTMQDIIEENQISRGGIYLYFDSVDQIFMEVIKERTTRRFDKIREEIKQNVPFDELFDSYLKQHKDRLLNSIEDSLSRAMYEYYFTHKSAEDRAFHQEQLTSTKNTILAILELGAAQGILKDEGLEELAENYMFVIEGLSVLALTGGIQESQIDTQLMIMHKLLPRG